MSAILSNKQRWGSGALRYWALDFGCGMGRMTEALAEFYGSVVGVDIHDEYPPTFLKCALSLFPHAKRVLHCPSGTVLGPGLRIDLVRDDVRVPQIVANAAALPLASGSMDRRPIHAS